MKADRSGTTTEQRMFRAGYQTASQRSQCGNCRHGHEVSEPNSGAIRYGCFYMECATTKTAICNEWKQK